MPILMLMRVVQLLGFLTLLGLDAGPAGAQTPAEGPRVALGLALERYRALAEGPELRPPFTRSVIRPDSTYADAASLRRYLVALGDLPASTPLSPAVDTLYRGDLVDATRRFQQRHALVADGVIGPATMQALRVPLAHRARQLELAAERWDAVPRTAGGRFLVVNVPAFRLYAFDGDGAADRPVVRMNVIVGTAGSGSTPVFSGTMREVVFQPYWDVPPGIARRELVPAIRRDAGYLEREHLEIVHGGDHDAVRYPPIAENLDRVIRGSLRLRQRPGPWNSLGDVKLLFPNRFNVYLHGTPAHELVAATRRDFSHGCIRIEDPVALTAWVMRAEGWDRAAVLAAMHDGPMSRRVVLRQPIAVHVIYSTAVVADDGRVHFYADVYGHDTR